MGMSKESQRSQPQFAGNPSTSKNGPRRGNGGINPNGMYSNKSYVPTAPDGDGTYGETMPAPTQGFPTGPRDPNMPYRSSRGPYDMNRAEDPGLPVVTEGAPPQGSAVPGGGGFLMNPTGPAGRNGGFYGTGADAFSPDGQTLPGGNSDGRGALIRSLMGGDQKSYIPGVGWTLPPSGTPAPGTPLPAPGSPPVGSAPPAAPGSNAALQAAYQARIGSNARLGNENSIDDLMGAGVLPDAQSSAARSAAAAKLPSDMTGEQARLLQEEARRKAAEQRRKMGWL